MSIVGRIRGSLQERTQRDFFFHSQYLQRIIQQTSTRQSVISPVQRHEGTKIPDDLNFFQNLNISQHTVI